MAGAGCLPCKVNLRLISNHQPRHPGVTRSRFSQKSQQSCWHFWCSVRWPGSRVGCELLHNTHRMWCLRVWYTLVPTYTNLLLILSPLKWRGRRLWQLGFGLMPEADSRQRTIQLDSTISIYFTIDQRNPSIFSVEALAFEGLLMFVVSTWTIGDRSTQENNGTAHFLEHMAFKGTKRRNRIQLEQDGLQIDAVFRMDSGWKYVWLFAYESYVTYVTMMSCVFEVGWN